MRLFPKSTLRKLLEIQMTIKDDLNTIIANQAALTAAIAAIPATGGTVDLTAVTAALATANTGIAAIEAQLQPTPAA